MVLGDWTGDSIQTGGWGLNKRLGEWALNLLGFESNTSSLKGVNILKEMLAGALQNPGEFWGNFLLPSGNFVPNRTSNLKYGESIMRNVLITSYWVKCLKPMHFLVCDLQWWNSLIVQSFSTGNQKFDPRKHFRWAEIFFTITMNIFDQLQHTYLKDKKHTAMPHFCSNRLFLL